MLRKPTLRANRKASTACPVVCDLPSTLQDVIGEGLYAQTQPVYAQCLPERKILFCDRIRVRLDGEFGVGDELKMILNGVYASYSLFS